MNLEPSYPKKLNRAEPEDLQRIYKHFYDCRKWFPHIRKDYLDRNIYAGNVIFDSNVIIIFNKYKRKQNLGQAQAQKGDVILHQILNPLRDKMDADRNAARKILDAFCAEMNTTVWLSVRADNDRAIAFYKKCGFEVASEITWMKGKLKGLVFVKRK